MTLLLLRELLLLLALAGAADLSFPTQFSAAYSTIAHQIPEVNAAVWVIRTRQASPPLV